MSKKNDLNFILIGAQKSGTTSLFEYLRQHDQIYMPPQKEVEFFQDDATFKRGRDWYLSKYFEDTGAAVCKGEASTKYMMYDCVPERIHQIFPSIKLLVLLRNPIDRAYSHYRMTVRKQAEQRPFEACIEEQTRRGKIKDSEIDPNGFFHYVYFGEYNRILDGFLRFFPRENIGISFSEFLQDHPVKVLQEIYGFLGVRTSFIPSNINKRYHVGGSERIHGLSAWMRRRWEWLQRSKFLRVHLLWRIDFEALIFRIKTDYNVKPLHDAGLSQAAREMLREHYAEDVANLSNAFGVTPPWSDFTSK